MVLDVNPLLMATGARESVFLASIIVSMKPDSKWSINYVAKMPYTLQKFCPGLKYKRKLGVTAKFSS